MNRTTEQLTTELAEYEQRKSVLFAERDRLNEERSEIDTKLASVNQNINMLVRNMMSIHRELQGKR